MMTRELIERSLERLGRALSAGDLKEVSSCWAVPALVLNDDGATAFSSKDEIERIFAQATEWYRTRGLTSTRPELDQVVGLSDRLAAVDVRWLAFDASGVEKTSERSHYIVQLGEDGEAHIRVALSRNL